MTDRKATERKADAPPSPAQQQDLQRYDRRKQEELDTALRDSFPASDPPAISQPSTATGTMTDRPLAKTGDRIRDELAHAHSRVDVSTAEEIAYWTDRLGVSADELKKAVRQVGFFPQEVADYLGKTL